MCNFDVQGGPATFGPNLDVNRMMYQGRLTFAEPDHACSPLDNSQHVKGTVVAVRRGACMFLDKVKFIESKLFF
jgi:hypothetical protein